MGTHQEGQVDPTVRKDDLDIEESSECAEKLAVLCAGSTRKAATSTRSAYRGNMMCGTESRTQ
jgi:hypothetical protein